jgi:hypothetical protein
MDIAAPGNFDIGAAYSKDAFGGSLGEYDWFGGTSAAGPHVAGASALLLQWDPTLNHNQTKLLLQQNARTDAFTGVTPNADWGHGKLDVLACVNQSPVCDADGPYQVECQGASTMVSLDGSGSGDPNAGDVLSYDWTTSCAGDGFDDSTLPMPMLSLDPGCFDCSASLTVTDLAGESDVCSAAVSINDTLKPAISCPMDVTIECDEPTDPSHTGFATATDICDASPSVEVTASHTVPGACPQESVIIRTWTASDACGLSSSCDQRIDVEDTTPPTIDSVSASPDQLWPPNHKMRPVEVSVDAQDRCDHAPFCRITSVSSNEPENGAGDGNTEPDWDITGDLSLDLRAERSGGGSGRIYTVEVTCSDACGNSSEEEVTVTVPHNMGGE